MNDKYLKLYGSRSTFKRKIYRKLLPDFLREKLQKIRGKGIYKDYYDHNKCIFIHIPKNAGQSISESLFNDRYPGHWSLEEFQWENKKKAKLYFKFCVVRNPYTRLYSAFKYLSSDKCTKLDKIFYDKVLYKYTNFESFVYEGLKDKEVINWVHFKKQVSFISNRNNEIAMDFICHLESLDEDFAKLKESLGHTEAVLKNINKTSSCYNIDSIYTNEMKEIVYEHYFDDFELLGYNS